MTPTGERPPMELRGLRRLGEVLAAVLVLEGAGRDGLEGACGLGAMMVSVRTSAARSSPSTNSITMQFVLFSVSKP